MKNLFILGAIFTLVTITSCWLMNGSLRFASCVSGEHNQTKYDKNTSEENPSSIFNIIIAYRHCTGDFVTHYKDIIAALSAFLLLFITSGLIWTGYKQITTTRAQLRAYCMVDRVEIIDVGAGKAPSARITIKNFGQTPAIDLVVWSVIGYDTYPRTIPTPPARDKADKRHCHPLAPGGALDIWAIHPTNIMEINDISKLTKSEVAFYVIGELRYKDAFGNTRNTKFSFFANGLTNVAAGNMAPSETGNTYT